MDPKLQIAHEMIKIVGKDKNKAKLNRNQVYCQQRARKDHKQDYRHMIEARRKGVTPPPSIVKTRKQKHRRSKRRRFKSISKSRSRSKSKNRSKSRSRSRSRDKNNDNDNDTSEVEKTVEINNNSGDDSNWLSTT